MATVTKTRDDISDREQRRKARERFQLAERLEREYMRSLRLLTRQIDHMVKGLAPKGVVKNAAELQSMLRQYSRTIEPWARTVAEKIFLRISRKDEAAWAKLGKEMGRGLRKELNSVPRQQFIEEFLNEQVRLITSLPIEAAERVNQLTMEAAIQGTRASEVAKQILETGKVTENRARLIARTEIARTASGITIERAKHVGSTHYVWRTSGDSDVRESHKKLNGKMFAFAEPPEVEPGQRYHAGQFPNCRCYVEPVIVDETD
jgi:SPP1 gp7 family putative phage head morphogenesis protein